MNQSQINAATAIVLRDLLSSLPAKRDWLSPDTERMAREILSKLDGRETAPKETGLFSDKLPAQPVRIFVQGRDGQEVELKGHNCITENDATSYAKMIASTGATYRITYGEEN